jgi:hypothetical protein
VQVLGDKTVDGKKTVVVPGYQQVEQFTVVSYLGSCNGFDALLVAEVYEVPGVGSAVDIGECNAPGTGLNSGLYQFFGFKGSV